jgi:hypothetical protein
VVEQVWSMMRYMSRVDRGGRTSVRRVLRAAKDWQNSRKNTPIQSERNTSSDELSVTIYTTTNWSPTQNSNRTLKSLRKATATRKM